MRRDQGIRIVGLLIAGGLAAGSGGCSLFKPNEMTTGSISPNAKVVATPTRADRECLARAMYFESNRTDEDGMLAVGTVVMNRLDSPKYPGSVCEVVGQKKQFAAGALTKPVREQDRERIDRVADRVLAGERHEGVGAAMHFHTVGYTFKYTNMHYVALAGGNTFYEKTDREGYLPAFTPHAVIRTASGGLAPLQVASFDDLPAARAGTQLPQRPTFAATQLAYGSIVIPASVPTRYTSTSAQ